MFRNILSYCMVISLFMMAAGTALATPTKCIINFELSGAYVKMPVTTVPCGPLTVTFSTTKPNCDPYLGDWDGLAGEGWFCNQNGLNDVTIPPYPGGTWFLTWTACDPHIPANKCVITFAPLVDRVEGDIFDIDEPGGEWMKITAYDVNGFPITGPGGTITVIPIPPYQGDCLTQHWAVWGTGIQKVDFEGYKTVQTVGFGIDSLMITYTPAGGPIPALTEWGLVIFGVLLLGFISWVFLRRRKVIG